MTFQANLSESERKIADYWARMIKDPDRYVPPNGPPTWAIRVLLEEGTITRVALNRKGIRI